MSNYYLQKLEQYKNLDEGQEEFLKQVDFSIKTQGDKDAKACSKLMTQKELFKNKILREVKISEKQQNPFSQLHYSTDHLPFSHEFNSLLGLYGRHYIPILKARWYQLHGGILQKTIQLGNLFCDTRVHVCYPLVTEGGKNNIIYSVKNLMELGIKKDKSDYIHKEFSISEPISFHQESLVGKQVERLIDNPKVLSGEAKSPKKIKTKIENRGHLDNDFVEFDECNQLINSNAPEFQQAREYLSKSENPIGKNKIEKRSVDDLPHETVAYCPACTNSYYFQPFTKLPESFVLQGFGRRKIIPVGNIQNFLVDPSETLYTQKLQNNSFSELDYRNTLRKHLEFMRESVLQFSFTDKAIQQINECSLYLAGQAQIHSEKINNFMKISKWTIQSNLIKFSAILAGSYYKAVVDENFVLLAYMDLVELMQNTYDFIFERIYGDFDYGVRWGGADFKQKEVLKYLYDNKAFSRDSSQISIYDFIQELQEIYRVKETQARNRLREMRDKGLLATAQIGKNETKVWLKINPSEHQNYIKGDKGVKGYTLYNNVFLTKNDILGRVSPLSPLTPSKEIQTQNFSNPEKKQQDSEVPFPND